MKKYLSFLFLSCLTFSTVVPMEFGKDSACSSTEKHDACLNSKEETNKHGSLPSSNSELSSEHIKEIENLRGSSLGYAELFEQFKNRADLPQLLKTFLILDNDQNRSYPTYVHLMIKALIAQHHQTGNYGPDHTDNILPLFTYFETEFPQIADSLKMSFYLYLPIPERILLDNFLVPHLSVEKFFEQVSDKNSLSDIYKSLSLAYAYMNYLKGNAPLDTTVFADLFSIQLTPFLLSLLNKHRLSDDFVYQLFNKAFIQRNLHLIEYFCKTYEINPNTIISPKDEAYKYHPLWVAAVLRDLPMVKKLLELGANPLAMVGENKNYCVIEGILCLCPQSSFGLPDRGLLNLEGFIHPADYEYLSYETDKDFTTICCKIIQSFIRNFFPPKMIRANFGCEDSDQALIFHLKYLNKKLKYLKPSDEDSKNRLDNLIKIVTWRINAYKQQKRMLKMANNSFDHEESNKQTQVIPSLSEAPSQKLDSGKLFEDDNAKDKEEI